MFTTNYEIKPHVYEKFIEEKQIYNGRLEIGLMHLHKASQSNVMNSFTTYM